MTGNGFDLQDVLAHIDPVRLDYQEWANVGMALKHEGYQVSDWEAWSARDSARFHPGECDKKWRTFNGNANPVTGGTLVQYAKQAFDPKPKDRNSGMSNPRNDIQSHCQAHWKKPNNSVQRSEASHHGTTTQSKGRERGEAVSQSVKSALRL